MVIFAITMMPLMLAIGFFGDAEIVTSKVWLALITLVTTSVALWITKWIESRTTLKAKMIEHEAVLKVKEKEAEAVRLAKEQDWKRQDEVAKRVEETAKQTAAAAELLLAANERVAENAGVMNDKLDVIHTWVNAKMTEAMQSELESKEVSLALLLEIVDLKKASGHSPTSETLGKIKSMSARVAELKLRIAERLKQQAVIDSKPTSQ